MTPIHIVPGSWTHTCLRIPGKQGIPTKIHMDGTGGCIFCGQPGPIEQKQIDALAAKKLVDTKPLKPKENPRSR